MNCPICGASYKGNEPPVVAVSFYWGSGGLCKIPFTEAQWETSRLYYHEEVVDYLVLPLMPIWITHQIRRIFNQNLPSYNELADAWEQAHALWQSAYVCVNPKHIPTVFWDENGTIIGTTPDVFAQIIYAFCNNPYFK